MIPLAGAFIGGVLVSTLLTLFLVPIFCLPEERPPSAVGGRSHVRKVGYSFAWIA
jgi:hypothetical protein